MRRDDPTYVSDMLDRCLRVQRLIDGLDFEAFAEDEPVRVTVAHYLQDMGEAARRVSSAFQGAHSEVPWREIIATRNRIAHDYTDIDFDIVWDVATAEVPSLIDVLRPLAVAEDAG
jgi:uncharacterized protein with HEPN domain